MPTRSRLVRDAAGRPPTATELARRAQITQATIEIVDRAGWAGCTLQAVADRLGITKAAVVYHVGTKEELLRQAYEAVIGEFTTFVGARVDEAADPRAAVLAFAVAHLSYLRAHRDHARVIVGALDPGAGADIADSPETPRRATPLIALIDEARGDAAAPARDVTAVVLATALNGVVDAAVAAWLDDPGFDLGGAEGVLAELVDRLV